MSRSPMNPRVLRTLTSLVLAGVLMVATMASAQSAEITESSPLEVGVPTGFVPVVDAAIDRDSLPVDGEQNVPLGASVGGASSALVRISVFDTAVPVTITNEGAPVLRAPAGVSTSTSVLLPVVDGGVRLGADVEAEARVEVLATFKGNAATGGSVNVLPKPVTRASTTNQMGGDDLATPLTVGLVGEGGVPSTHVRAVFVTINVTLASPGTITAGGQELALPAGVSAVSTVLVPSETGDTTISSTAAGQLSLDVRGWVTETTQELMPLNVAGSIQPIVADPTTSVVAAGTPEEVAIPARSDAAWSLVIGSATATQRTTAFAYAESDKGRTRGAVIDSKTGATPQLMVAGAENHRVHVFEGTTQVTTLVVAEVVGDARAGADPATTVMFTTPAENATIDLTGGTFTLAGIVKSQVAIDRIEILADNSVIGHATVRYVSGGLAWTYETAVPSSKRVDFTVRVVSRGGDRQSAERSVNVVLPSADQVVVNHLAAILTEDQAATVSGVSADTVTFNVRPDLKPGQPFVSGVSANAPEGFLRVVAAIDQVDGAWVVRTKPAALTDILFQVNFTETADALEDATLTPIVPASDTETEVIDDGVPAVELVDPQAPLAPPSAQEGTPQMSLQGDSDSSPLQANGREGKVLKAPSATLEPNRDAARSVQSQDLMAPKAVVETSRSVNGSVSYTYDPIANKGSDTSNASAANKEKEKAKVAASAGFSLEAAAKASVSIKLVLNIRVQWGWVPKPVVDDFSLTSSVGAEVNATFSAYLKASVSRSWSRNLAGINLPPVTFAVGPVPVIITSQLTVGFKMSLSAATTFETRASVKATKEVGFKYSSSGGLQQIDKQDQDYETPFFGPNGVASVTGSIRATAGPSLDLAFKIYDVAGPYAKLALEGGIKGSLTSDQDGYSGELKLFLQLTGTVGVRLTVPVIDHVLLDESWSLTQEIELAVWNVSGGGSGPPPEPGSDVLGPGVSLVEEKTTGGANQWGHLTGFAPGAASWVLTTGLIDDVVGQPSELASTNLGGPGNASLASMIGGSATYDSASYLATIKATGSMLHIRYAFASEEYPEYVDSQFNDVMGVFVNGQNCATVPGTNLPVAVNSVNHLRNTEYYVDNSAGASGYNTVMDGITKPLQCSVPVTPGSTVTVEIAVADTGDAVLDSAVALLDGGIWSE